MSTSKLETAKRALQNCKHILRYAIATGRADQNPAEHLRGALPPARSGHLTALTEPQEFGAILRAIDAYSDSTVLRAALQLAPLVFVRPGELRAAEWSEMDFAKAEWQIPAQKMKMRANHIVQLSRQAMEFLKNIQPLTVLGPYVFPSVLRIPRQSDR